MITITRKCNSSMYGSEYENRVSRTKSTTLLFETVYLHVLRTVFKLKISYFLISVSVDICNYVEIPGGGMYLRLIFLCYKYSSQRSLDKYINVTELNVEEIVSFITTLLTPSFGNCLFV